MRDEFLPTQYDEYTDTTTTYRRGFFYQLRDVGQYTSDDIMVAVLADIHDAMREHPEIFTPDRVESALADYEKACADVKRAEETGDYTVTEWLSDATFYAPNGVSVEWDGEAGTVLVSVDKGWETEEEESAPAPHTGHYSRLGGTYWCDTCNSPYCELA